MSLSYLTEKQESKKKKIYEVLISDDNKTIMNFTLALMLLRNTKPEFWSTQGQNST